MTTNTEKTYSIIRFYADDRPSEVITRGWFDGYDEEA